MRKKKTESGKPIIAICYDFDKTLSPKDMQEYTVFPKLECEASEFWKESNAYAKDNGMDKILSYMKLICDKCSNENVAITNTEYTELGKKVELYNGVITWFERINKFGHANGLEIEHYIISAGLKEIIDGTPIRKEFTEVFASSFIFDAYGRPVWPRQVVNYTTKTQYLFRINKACTGDLSDENCVNQYTEEDDRRIPFRNFIYIGDSDTDIPAMKLVKKGGGHSIGVYNPSLVDIEKTSKLIGQDRIDFFVSADYSENSKIEEITKNIILKIKYAETLDKLNHRQKDLIYNISYIKTLLPWIKKENEETNEIDNDMISFVQKYYKSSKKNLSAKYSDILSKEEIEKLVSHEEQEMKRYVSEKKKKIKTAKKATEEQNETRDKTEN